MHTVKIIDIESGHEVLVINDVTDVRESIISGAAAITTEKANNIVRIEVGQMMQIIIDDNA